MIIALIAFATACATLAGGLTALRFKDRLHVLLGFSAGAVMGVAFFDLLPEAVGFSGRDADILFLWVAAGFLFYLVLDRLALLRADVHEAAPNVRGTLGASVLCLHSLLDGIAIGLAFHISTGIGAVVALAVVAHDFSDGINTANLVLKSGGNPRSALRWLIVDALAPVAGLAATFFFVLPNEAFGSALGFFAGLFLYIGASELVPESYHSHPKFLTTVMTLAGAGAIYLAVLFAK